MLSAPVRRVLHLWAPGDGTGAYWCCRMGRRRTARGRQAMGREQRSFDEYDYDSGISVGSGASAPPSMASSIFHFRTENGCTYHAYKADEAPYYIPNYEAWPTRMREFPTQS
ncbi:hypothetical protein VTI74DRAFT_2890 [Chaetomium olivicolor]